MEDLNGLGEGEAGLGGKYPSMSQSEPPRSIFGRSKSESLLQIQNYAIISNTYNKYMYIIELTGMQAICL